MNSLIIGSSSIIGSAIADDLSQLGLVLTAGRRNADFNLDLLAADSLPTIGKQFDTVIMVAADFGGPNDSDFLRATRVNVLGAIKAVSIASQVGAKQFVLISSISACYKPHEDYYNAYALTKFQSEQAAAFSCDRHKIGLSIVRPSAVFDTQGKCRQHQQLFYAIIDCAREGNNFVISGSADPLRNFVHITDVASLVTHVVAEAKVGTFVCAQPESLPISVIAKTAYKVFGNGGHINFDRSKPDIAACRPLLDGSEGDTNWKPSITIEEGMRIIRTYGNGDA